MIDPSRPLTNIDIHEQGTGRIRRATLTDAEKIISAFVREAQRHAPAMSRAEILALALDWVLAGAEETLDQ